MKVLIISPTFPPMRSGGADFVLRYAEHLSEHGVSVTVLSSLIEDAQTSDSFVVANVVPNWDWRDLFKIRRIVQGLQPDVVEIHFTGSIYHHQPMITCLPILLRKWVAPLRIVLHIEYPEPVQERRLRSPTRLIREALLLRYGRAETNWGYGTLLRESERVTVLCDTHRAQLVKEFPAIENKCITITQPATIRISKEDGGQTRLRARKELQQPTDAPLLVYYGYIYPNKGIETLLEAFAIVTRNFHTARLLVLGGANEVVLKATNRPNYLSELRELTGELGVAEKVIWTDYFPTESEQPSFLLRAADIGVLPFDDGISMHRSTFGVVASHHLPIVTTRRPQMEFPFRDGENVILCPPKDSRALAEAVMTLLRNSELQARLRKGVDAMAREFFSWDRCIAQRLAVLEGREVPQFDTAS